MEFNVAPLLHGRSPRAGTQGRDQPLTDPILHGDDLSTKKADSSDKTSGWTKAARERLAEWDRQHPLESEDIKVEETDRAYKIRRSNARACRNSAKPQDRENCAALPTTDDDDDERWNRNVEQRLALERDAQAARDLADELERAEKSKKSSNTPRTENRVRLRCGRTLLTLKTRKTTSTKTRLMKRLRVLTTVLAAWLCNRQRRGV